MALILRGVDFSTTPTPVRFSEGRRNSDGTLETDVTYAVGTEWFFSNVVTGAWPQRGVTEHPHSTAFKADTCTWSTPMQGVTLVRVLFFGVIPVTLTPGSPLPLDVEEEANNSISEEPITTLINFLEDVGDFEAICPPLNGAWPTVDGKAVTVEPETGRWPMSADLSEPLKIGNGAIFDTFGQNKYPDANDYNPNVGRFLYFAPGSPFVGQESYVLARGEWSYSYATTTQPNLSDAGKIGIPPGLSDPGAPLNYLCSAKAYTRRGFVYRARDHWRRSGPRGWNPKVYPAIV